MNEVGSCSTYMSAVFLFVTFGEFFTFRRKMLESKIIHTFLTNLSLQSLWDFFKIDKCNVFLQ